MRVFKSISLFTVAVLVAACSDKSDTNAQEQGGDDAAVAICADNSDIIASGAWIRPSRSGQPTSAAYVSLTNCSADDDVLTGVAFAGASAVELHATKMTDDGVASMTPTGGVDLAAGAKISMAPGGAHIMLIGMTDPVVAESAPTLTLEFENAPAMEIVFEVRDAAPDSAHNHH